MRQGAQAETPVQQGNLLKSCEHKSFMGNVKAAALTSSGDQYELQQH